MSIRSAGGLSFSGEVFIHDPPIQLAAVIDDLGQAYLRVKNETCWTAPGRNEINMWLSLYERSDDEARRLQDSLDEMLVSLFPGGS